MRVWRWRGPERVLVGVLVAISSLACSGSSGSDGSSGPGDGADSVTLRVLAGSELEDLEPILADAAEATAVTVDFDFVGTLDGIQQVVDGRVAGQYDALWFSSNRYLALHPEAQASIRSETRIMTSPVILGLSAAKAQELGWDGGAEVSWSAIAAAAADGRFTYGMTNPAASNSGFSAVVAVTAALSGTGAALEPPDIDAVAGELQGFFSGQQLIAGSSGWLAEAYVARATGTQPGLTVDGLINYESVLLSLNDDSDLPEPMTLIYPSDGVITADYPLTLLDSASEAAGDGYERLVDYLLTAEAQTAIMNQTHRRPAVAEVERSGQFGAVTLVELPFPARLEVVDGLIATYFDRLRRPVRTVYVLDVSGSMAGDRITALREALVGLTGADDTLASQARQFHSREEITLLPFNHAPQPSQAFVVPEDDADEVRADIRDAAEGLEIGGDTAVYDSLMRAYELLARASAGDFATSIVLMTDGENNAGAGLEQFIDHHAGLAEPLRNVPVFPVLFGEANTAQMEEVAALTGGRTFDARSGGLETAFQEIRGYQ